MLHSPDNVVPNGQCINIPQEEVTCAREPRREFCALKHILTNKNNFDIKAAVMFIIMIIIMMHSILLEYKAARKAKKREYDWEDEGQDDQPESSNLFTGRCTDTD